MKPALLFIVGLIFLLILIGLATLHGTVLALAIPLMAYLFTAILQRPERIALVVTREVAPDHAQEGTPITVKLHITNQGGLIDELTVQDVTPQGVKQLSGKSSEVTFLPVQGKIDLEYTIEAPRGEYSAYEVQVYARDVLSLFEIPHVYQTSPRFFVHPRYPKLERINIRPPQTRGFAGPIAARQGGSGIGFWGIREFQMGDPRRQINWRRSSRPGHPLYTNVFEQERVADVGLILDARQRSSVTTASGSLFEYSVRATAALAENFLDDGNRVSLLVEGAAMSRVFPGYGRVQRNRILKALAQANPGLNYALESLENLPIRLFPAKSQIVMVSTLLPDDIGALIRLRAHGFAVMVISPDPVYFEAASNQDFTSLAYRFASAERMLMLRQIRYSGVPVVNWIVDQPLETAIQEALARQTHLRHIDRLVR